MRLNVRIAANRIEPGWLRELRQIWTWRSRGYLDHAPQYVKERVFLKYGLPGEPWIETGTYLGTTTRFLSQVFPMIYSIEPSVELYEAAVKQFENKNVELINDVSEEALPILLSRLSGSLNFWLDGHYSSGITFKGQKECPVEDELRVIQGHLGKFQKVTLLIDDVRCFVRDRNSIAGYPSLDYLVDWARTNRFSWRIEQDIFIMQKDDNVYES